MLAANTLNAAASSIPGNAFSLWPKSYTPEQIADLYSSNLAEIDSHKDLCRKLDDPEIAKRYLSQLEDIKGTCSNQKSNYKELEKIKRELNDLGKDINIEFQAQIIKARKAEEARKIEEEKREADHRRKLEEQQFQEEKAEKARLIEIKNAKYSLNERLESVERKIKNIKSEEEKSEIIDELNNIRGKIQELDNIERIPAIDELINEFNNKIDNILMLEEQKRQEELKKSIETSKEELLIDVSELEKKSSSLDGEMPQVIEIKQNIEKFKSLIPFINSGEEVEKSKKVLNVLNMSVEKAHEEQVKKEEEEKEKAAKEEILKAKLNTQQKVELISSGEMRLEDVHGGNQHAKDSIKDLVQQYREKERLIEPPKGILLYGPPGTGKTTLVLLVAADLHIPVFTINPSMVMGEDGKKNLLNIFQAAKKEAEVSGSPVILLIDEIDAIAQSRSTTSTDKILVLLMNLMDGLAPRDNVIVIATTNRKEAIDTALLRADRLDLSAEVPLPNNKDKRRIFDVYLKGFNVNIDESELTNLIANKTRGCSGADIERIVKIAISLASQRSKSKRLVDLTITMEDLRVATARVVAGKI